MAKTNHFDIRGNKGYKGFDQNLKCRVWYEVGGEYEHEGEVDCCRSWIPFLNIL